MPRHRKHIKNPYLDYEAASALVRKEGITTRAQYLEWHKTHKPGYLPRWPHHVWDNFSWNDFLNTTNSFDKTRLARKGLSRQYRPMWEAVRYAQHQAKLYSLSTRKEWEQFYEEYEVPDDIPKRPWQEYDEFPGIDVWLGNTAVAHAKTAREGDVAIVALHHVVGAAPNVVMMRVWKDGYSAMKAAMLDDNGMSIGRVIRAFEVEDEKTIPFVESMLHKHGSKGPDGFIVRDVNGLLWDLIDLLIATGKKVG